MNNNEIRYSDQTPPVLLLAFNRPDKAARVLERIKDARPKALYVACDGPRPGRDDDVANIKAIHEMVARIDWCANVKTRFRENNLGCDPAVIEAITWFLSDAGEGIILEDDCLPDPTFFRFCGEMLDRYRNTSNVMQVAGYNYLSGMYEMEFDYVFSQCGWQWGWATWKRAWDSFDLHLANWPKFKELGFHRHFPFFRERVQILDKCYTGKTTAWDYKWQFAIGSRMGVSVVPKFSLIENIGFGPGATHATVAVGNEKFQRPAHQMVFPLTHSPFIYADLRYDRMSLRVFRSGGFRMQTKNTIANLLYLLFSR